MGPPGLWALEKSSGCYPLSMALLMGKLCLQACFGFTPMCYPKGIIEAC